MNNDANNPELPTNASMNIPAGNMPLLPPDESRGPTMLGITWLCAAVACVFLGCRLYARLRVTRNAALDDALITVSVMSFIVLTALGTASISNGFGRRLVHLRPDQVSKILYFNAIAAPVGLFANTLPKLAVVMLISRLVGPVKHLKRGISLLYLIVAILALSTALSSVFLFAQCDPPSHFWDPATPAKCWSPNVLEDTALFSASWSAFADLSLATYPILIVWDLQMNVSRKIGISALMGLGVFAMISAIIRTVNMARDGKPDFSWGGAGLVIWTSIETTAVIVAACTPTLPHLVLRLLGKEKKPTYEQPPRVDRLRRGSQGPYDKILENPVQQSPADDDVEMRTVSNGSGSRDNGDRWDSV